MAYKVEKFVERLQLVMIVHVSREDQMGDTTKDIVIAERCTNVGDNQIKSVVSRIAHG